MPRINNRAYFVIASERKKKILSTLTPGRKTIFLALFWGSFFNCFGVGRPATFWCFLAASRLAANIPHRWMDVRWDICLMFSTGICSDSSLVISTIFWISFVVEQVLLLVLLQRKLEGKWFVANLTQQDVRWQDFFLRRLRGWIIRSVVYVITLFFSL